MEPDLLTKHRRFALAIGLILITYVAAGIKLKSGGIVELMRLPFEITRAEWLPVGLILASIYSGARFYYWGAMRTESPSKRRAPYRALAFSGVERDGFLLLPDGTNVEGVPAVRHVADLFPRVGLAEAQVTVSGVPDMIKNDPDHPLAGQGNGIEKMDIPRAVNWLARLEEFDYFAPVWLNACAVYVASAQIVQGSQ